MAELWAFAAWVVRALFRFFFTGQAIDGRPRDNATFLQPANVDHRGNPTEKLSAARWKRVARRWAVAGVPLCLATMSVVARVWQDIAVVDPPWVLVEWRDMAFRWWIVLSLGLSLFYGWKGVQFLRHRKVTDDFVYPAWEAACDAMGYKFRASEARRMVSLPDGFDSPDAAVRHGWLQRLRERHAKPDKLPEEPADIEPPGTDLAVRPAAELQPYKQPPWAGLIPRRRAGSHVADEDNPEDAVRITLIPGKCATKAEEGRFVQKVGPYLGMPDAKSLFVRKTRSPYVLLWPNHPPPPEYTFAEFRRHLGRADIDHIPIGLSHGGRLEFLNFVDDTAHVLVSAESNRGKTNFIKVACAILMHLGCQMVVLDFKLISHRWAHNLPGCNYASEVESTDTEPGIHELLIAIGAEIKRRRRTAIPHGADVDTPLNTFPTLIILVEEQNALSERLRDYWTATRTPRDPVSSPALTALREAIYTGREFGVRIISVAQMATANMYGANGGAARESFSTRVLGGWTTQAWKMLARGLPFVLCPPGRGVFAVTQSDGRAPIIRSPKITDREARDLAMSGVPSPGQALGAAVVVEGETVVEQVTPTEPIQPELVDLRTVVEGNMLPGPAIAWEAIRKASQRDGKVPFPQPAGMLGVATGYRLSELVEWKETRDGVRPPLALVDTPGRPGIIYQFNTLDPDVPGEIEIGYIGQTRWLNHREDQHRGDKPWADLIVGDPIIIWQSPCTDPELDDAELDAIQRLKPRYNVAGQEGAPHAMPKWTQVEQRQARNQARGLPPWEPENRYEMSQLAQLSHAETR